MVRRPSLSASPKLWFDDSAVFRAWDLFVSVLDDRQLTGRSTFLYDLVDVTREALQLLVRRYYRRAKFFFGKKDEINLGITSRLILRILNDLETLLASNHHFLAGRWIENARDLGVTLQEKELYEFNARNQITLWGPKGEILDYATKQWSGMVSGYFYPRWKLFLDSLRDCLSRNVAFNQSLFDWKVSNFVEQQFVYSRDAYPSRAVGDSVRIARRLWRAYRRSVK